MINPKDEYLHEYRKSTDWIETFSVNLVDKKNKLFGFADVSYFFGTRKTEYLWALFYNEDLYTYKNQVGFDGNLGHKIHSDRGFKYKVVSPLDKFELNLKNSALAAGLTFSGVYPIYMFPASVPQETENGSDGGEIKFWERYEQRCRVSGYISMSGSSKKGSVKKIDCIGHRKHSWGERYPERMSIYSWITIQFRDMAIDLTYMEIGRNAYSNGFISKRTGNIPITSVELELLSFSRENSALLSTEFSYKDAQDDRDLIVSKKLHHFEMPLPKNKKSKFVRFRAFSDFTIIGTNKRGIGMEEHYIAVDKLRHME
jgi:hypothetical protein